MLLWLLFVVVLMLMFFGECIVIGDRGIVCSECGWEVCIGDRSGMCGSADALECGVITFRFSFNGNVSFICVSVGMNVGEDGLKCM